MRITRMTMRRRRRRLRKEHEERGEVKEICPEEWKELLDGYKELVEKEKE